jgi:phytoene synthase
MSTKSLFDSVSFRTSKLTTQAYSTSFSLGIRLLAQRFQAPIYGVYGFVRFADEIVDTFHDYDKASLLQKFRSDTYAAIADRISLNPILNAFQTVVHAYRIPISLIDTFLDSMAMDLDVRNYDREQLEKYILGSAEAVGLMCLCIFVDGAENEYNKLKYNASRLGSAFQKINFLRDLRSDCKVLGRAYFPGLDFEQFDAVTKARIEEDIAQDFADGLAGIKLLPKDARFGVYIAYVYYMGLFRKIQRLPHHCIMEARVRIPNQQKYALLIGSYFRHQLNII